MPSDSMLSVQSAGLSVPPHPYRGGDGGKLAELASMPSLPMGGGKLASFGKSIGYGACRQSSLPVKSSLPPHRTTTNVRQAQKQTVSRVREGYQKQNLEAAGIVLERIAEYGGRAGGVGSVGAAGYSKGETVKIRFGRYRGWNVKDVPVAYAKWLKRQPGVSVELRECITATLSGKATPAALHRRPGFDARMAAAGPDA